MNRILGYDAMNNKAIDLKTLLMIPGLKFLNDKTFKLLGVHIN
jgi:hypothetical protein